MGAGQSILPKFLSLESLKHSSFIHLAHSLSRVAQWISDKDSLLDQTLARLLNPLK